ncbi:unnamed protein product [Clonostachys rosea f. rosea IK726]|nr:unnamed protein product [Clonostachys rosea f. rosea IK726]
MTVNWYFVLSIIIVSCGSIPKGYDEGGYSASVGLKSFETDFNLLASNWKNDANGLATLEGNIKSFSVLGAACGTLIALLINDRLGRLRSFQLAICLWMSGLFMQIFASGIIGLLLFARIWAGLGAGILTVVSPLYLSEIAPTKSRGMVVTVYMVFLLSFLMFGETLSFFINFGANKGLLSGRMQYRLVQAIPLIPVGLALVGSFFLSDTPRWLASKGRVVEATAALERLRKSTQDDEALATERADIQDQAHHQTENLSQSSIWTIFKEIATDSNYRERFLLGAAVQTIAQWTGGNGITFYIPQIFKLAGVTSSDQSLITSGAYGAVKLVFTMLFAWCLVDIWGRRKTMFTGLWLQAVAHAWMAIYMSLFSDGSNKHASNAAIASVFIYAVGWSIGLCNTQALYGTEIYPTRIRSVCYAFNMMLHWFFQFAVVRVTPNMFVGLGVSGAYIFWTCVCAVGILLLGVWAPETKGVPMERMDELFSGPWYMGWRAKISPSADPLAGTDTGKDIKEVTIERVA